MRADRLLSMLMLLQLRGCLTAQALADAFEISVRTAYRDIDALSAAGIPVYADRGPGGGFRLLDGYRTRLTGLTAAEAATLPLIGLARLADDLGLAAPHAAARLKLLAALPPATGDGAIRVGSRVHVDPAGWHRRLHPPEHLPTIAQAVWDGRRLAIGYRSWVTTVRRTLDPLGLVAKAGAWYLVARADGDSIRTYKVAEVQELAVLDERFTYPQDFDLTAHWQSALDRFEAGLVQGQASLRVARNALPRIEQLGAAAAEAVLAAPEEDGWRHIVVPIEGIGYTARLLLGFADDIQVLAPVELCQELARCAGQVLALYDHATVRAAPPPADLAESTRSAIGRPHQARQRRS